MTQPALIIDVSNVFIRSWAAYPTMSSHGYQMGGCIGFLKTLRYLVADNHPGSVYCVWESGGSARRRALYSEYKMNRKPEKLNRFYEDDIPESEDNRKHQMLTLLALLKTVPVCQLYVPDCEGDDVIAYLAKGPLKDQEKIIVSSDKDMYQLLDEKTKVYNLHKKVFVTKEDVYDEFHIHPNNFALAKALCGDKGDNVPGIKGLGFKSVFKKFPMLALEQDVTIQEVLNYAQSHRNDGVIFDRICSSESEIRRNWRLVYLDGSMMSASQTSRIDYMLEKYAPKMDRIAMVKLLIKEGLGNFDVSFFFNAFSQLMASIEKGEVNE